MFNHNCMPSLSLRESSVTLFHNVIAQLDMLFHHGLDSAIKQREPQRIRDLWSTLIANGKCCVEHDNASASRSSILLFPAQPLKLIVVS